VNQEKMRSDGLAGINDLSYFSALALLTGSGASGLKKTYSSYRSSCLWGQPTQSGVTVEKKIKNLK